MKHIDLLRKYEPKFNSLKPVDTGYSTKCWIWTKTRWSNGYGRISGERTHRIAYEIVYGDIKKGRSILHKCDNKLCCRPDHLYSGTHAQNMKDYVKRGAEAHSGELNKNSVLSKSEVLFVRWLYETMNFSLCDIASMLSIGKSTVNRIRKRSTWQRVEGEFKPSKSTIKKMLANNSGEPVKLTMNFRNDADLNMVAGLHVKESQQDVYRSLGISRGSVRHAVGRAPNPMKYSDAVKHRYNYLKWRRQCEYIISCLK